MLRIRYNAAIQNTKSGGVLTSYNTYYNSTKSNDSINQQKKNIGDNRLSNLILIYREPISKYIYLEFHYNYNCNTVVQNKQTNNYINGEYLLYDSSLSSTFKSRKIINDLGIKFTYENNRQLFDIGTRARHLSINNNNILLQNQIKQYINNILPYMNYRYGFGEDSHLNLNYNTSSDQPSIAFLQPVNDNSNPNQIFVGNSSLLPTFNHNFNMSFDKFNPNNGKNLWCNISLSSVTNDFATYTIYDSLGRSIEKIINTNGNYNSNFSINGATPFFSKIVVLSPNVNLGYNKNTNYINSQKNISKNLAANAGLNISITLDTLVFNLSGSCGYNIPTSTLNNIITKPYFTQNYSASLLLQLQKRISIESNINYTINNKRANGYNINYIIWNVSLSKEFLKNGNFIISIIGNDILNQNINTSRDVYNNVIKDTKTNIVRRYFLLKLASFPSSI